MGKKENESQEKTQGELEELDTKPFQRELIYFMADLNEMWATPENPEPLEMPDQVLILLYLTTEQKAEKFFQWVRRHQTESGFDSTPAKVLSAATRIGRDMEPND